MAGNILPLSNATHIGVIDSGGERIVLIDELRSHFGVNALIRLHADEFNALSHTCRILVHFNLDFTLNEVGRRYAVVPIVRAGYRSPGGQEVLPVINPTSARRGICTEVIQHLPIHRVTEEQLSESLPHIRSPAELQTALLHRYGRMFPNMSDREILDRSCAITRIAFDD